VNSIIEGECVPARPLAVVLARELLRIGLGFRA